MLGTIEVDASTQEKEEILKTIARDAPREVLVNIGVMLASLTVIHADDLDGDTQEEKDELCFLLYLEAYNREIKDFVKSQNAGKDRRVDC